MLIIAIMRMTVIIKEATKPHKIDIYVPCIALYTALLFA